MEVKKITTEIEVFEKREDLPHDEQSLLESATSAMKDAYAPYSEFRVGAAVLLENNEIITGNNQENAAYPSGLCAERVAVFYAAAKYPGVSIQKIAITAASPDYVLNHPIAPCGACRQSILEYEIRSQKDIVILLSGETGNVYRIRGVRELLPLYFGQDILTKGK